MTERLSFGTAGLRAPLGEGPLRMNVHTVELAAKAVAKWLPPNSMVVVGRDARHGSEDFANVTARVLAEAGHTPQLFPAPVPTPVVASAVRFSNAAGGVMVTASHNPATDNGYKVYAADSGQILPEDAAIIEATMAALPWPTDVSTELPGDIELLGDPDISTYLSTISESVESDARISTTRLHRSGISIAYSAMHGVGGELFVRALEGAGHRVVSVAEQHEPDPDFPTAAFPNPEEPGTLDLVMALADAEGADIVMANDPDADRLAVAVKRDAGWERLTGDQIGALLGWYIIERTTGPRSVATTIVSSTLLGKVAAAADVTCHHTLTGFKWLARTDAVDAPLVFAYEEALGYSVVPTIRDKDGISAALAFAELVAELSTDGHTADEVLQNLYAEHGVHLTGQVSARFDGDDSMQQMTQRMAELRSQPPASIGGCSVLEIIDYAEGAGELAPSNVLTYSLDGGRLVVRPSGTEPKIKAYIEAVDHDRSVAQERFDAIQAAATELLA